MSDDDQHQIDQLQTDVDQLRTAVEALTDSIERSRSVTAQQTIKLLEMVNLLMGRLDDAARGSVLPDADRGATQVGQDDQER